MPRATAMTEGHYLRCSYCPHGGEGFAVVVGDDETNAIRYECMKCGGTDVEIGREAP